MKIKEKTPGFAVGWEGIWHTGKHVFGAMPVNRGLKTLFNLNQKGKIDCPSCAWPDPEHRSSIGEYCENGAKAIAEEATTRKLTLPFFQRYSLAELNEKSDYWLGQQGRLCEPVMIKEGMGHYQAISWEEAYNEIAKELNSLDSPNEATFYTSGRSSNEAAFLYQLFVRAFGTNNLPDCSNMCHESSGVALSETLGIGKGSVKLDDFEKAELIIIMGQNPGTNHPRMLGALEKAKKNGAKIVAVNPLIEPGLLGFKNPQRFQGLFGKGTTLTDLYLQLKINSDLALLQAVNKILITESRINEEFIAANTTSYDQIKSHLESLDLESLVKETGINQAKVQKLATWVGQSSKIIVCWAMGLTQHKNAVATIKEVVNLLLLRGSIGKPGAGTCPVRGHSNVQGDRSVGIMHKPSTQLNAALLEKYGFEPPKSDGLDVVESINAMHNNQVKVFMALGGNFLSAAPDTGYTSEALSKCQLTVHINTKLNRTHLNPGKTSLILPCLGRTDLDLKNQQPRFLSTENSMGIVQKTEGQLRPLSENMRSEPEIVANIGNPVLGEKYPIPWLLLGEDYGLIREHIADCIKGFEDYNKKIEEGFYLPNGPREGIFTTLDGKAHFSINTYVPLKVPTDRFILTTIRSHDQFNTTVYGLDDRYRGVYNERRVVFINPKDLEKLGKHKYEEVNIFSEYGGKKRIAEAFKLVPYNIPEGCLAAYFPETNILIPVNEYADYSQTPISKSVIVGLD